jgi:hypothetical protein
MLLEMANIRVEALYPHLLTCRRTERNPQLSALQNFPKRIPLKSHFVPEELFKPRGSLFGL